MLHAKSGQRVCTRFEQTNMGTDDLKLNFRINISKMLTGPAGGHCDDDDDEEEDEDGEGGRHVAPACVQPQLFGVPAWSERYIENISALFVSCPTRRSH